jgi:PKHD-type hydroxylase
MFFNQTILFTKEEVGSILYYMNDEESIISKKMIKHNGVLYKNGDFLRKKLVFTDENMWIFEKIKKWTTELNMSLIWKSTPFSAFRKYRKGDFFVKHIDNLNEKHTKRNGEHKILTISIQLSDEDEYEGGDFLVWDNDKEIIVDKKIGNTIMYSTNAPHEVKEITKGVRISLIVCPTDKNIKFNNSLM